MAKKIEIKWISTPDNGKRSMWIVPVCNPSGNLKYVRVSPQVQSGIVTAAFHEPDSAKAQLVNVQLKAGMADAGWAFMADLFADDGSAAGWQGFVQWMLDGPMCNDGAKVRPFPAKYLPSGVRDRLQGTADHQALPDEIVIPELDSQVTPKPSKRSARAAGLELDAP